MATSSTVLLGSVSATADSAYTPPTDVQVAPLNGGVDVSWEAGDDVSGYTYVATADPGGQTCTPGRFDPSTGCVIWGLDNGTSYTVTVVASHLGQSSQPSAPSMPVSPRSDFSAPQLESSSVSPLRLPASGGTVHVVAHITDTGSGLVDGLPQAQLEHWVASGVPLATTASVGLERTSGDVNDGIYEGDVVLPPGSPPGSWSVSFGTLADAAGNATWNAAYADDDVRVGLPAQVADVTAVPEPGRAIHVAWAPVTDDGGSPITGYRVRSQLGDVQVSGATSVDAVVPDTRSGAGPFTFQVQAINANGVSTPSAITAGVSVPDFAPDAPRSSTEAEDSVVSVNWQPPDHVNGSAVTSYTVTGTPGNLTCTRTSATGCSFPGVNGTRYTFTITATNAAGSSLPSIAIGDSTPYGTPSAPTSVHASRFGTAAIKVAWNAGRGAGRPVSDYVVTLAPRVGEPFVISAGADARSFTYYEARPDTPYTVSVAATSFLYTSAATVAPERITVPDVRRGPAAPAQPSVTNVTRASAVIHWRGVAVPGGLPVSSYLVRMWAGTALIRADTVGSTRRSIWEGGLPRGKPYRVTVYAINPAGMSSASTSTTFSLRR